MDGGGFEPPKAELADLQSAPFGHSGTRPSNIAQECFFIIYKYKILKTLHKHHILAFLHMACKAFRGGYRLIMKQIFVTLQ